MARDRILYVQNTKMGFKKWYMINYLSTEVIIFKWLALISLIVFSNYGSGSNFGASKLLLIQSGSEFSSKDVIADGFVAAEAILLRWLFLISIIFFSNVDSGSNFSASKLLFIQSWSKFLSKDVVILLIRNCDGSLTDISLITSVVSERHDFFELIVTSYSSIHFDSWCCCSMKSTNYSSGCSKIWIILIKLGLEFILK